MDADVFSDSVKQPARAPRIQVLVIVNAEHSFLPSIVLVIFRRVNDTAKKSVPPHEFLDQFLASVKAKSVECIVISRWVGHTSLDQNRTTVAKHLSEATAKL
jgi:hypothetical protein